MKKLMAITLALMLVFSAVAVSYAAPKWVMPPGQMKKMMFSDTGNHWAESTIDDLAERGLIKGYGDGTFKPSSSLSKLEALSLLHGAYYEGVKDVESVDFDYAKHYLYKGPAWGEGLYAWAFEFEVFGNSLKKFNANAAITRAEFAYYTANLAAYDSDFEWEWYEKYLEEYGDRFEIDDEYAGRVGFMRMAGLMIGDANNYFRGGGSLKRAEAAMVISRYTDWDETEGLEATIYLNGGHSTENVAVEDLEIKVEFSEDVYDEDGVVIDDDEIIIGLVTLVEDESDGTIDLEVDSFDDDEWIFVLDDEEELVKGETYRFEIENDSVYDSEGNELEGRRYVEFTTVDDRITAGLDPEDGTTGVAIGAEIAIEFSEEPFMWDGEDYVPFTTEAASEAAIEAVMITGENATTTGSVGFDIDYDGDTWVLDIDMEHNTTYTVKLDRSEIFTENGETFRGDSEYQFSTVENYELDFTVEEFIDSESELVDATLPTVVTIDFGQKIMDADNEDFDEDDLDQLVTILDDEFETPDFSTPVTLGWEFEGDEKEAVVFTVDRLDFDTEYTVTVDESLLYGGIEGDNSVTFSTYKPMVEGEYTSGSVVIFTFDGPVVDEEGDPLEADEYSVEVRVEDSTGHVVDGFTSELDERTLTVTFDDGGLTDDAAYWMKLSGFYYDDGGEYEETLEFEFEADLE